MRGTHRSVVGSEPQLRKWVCLDHSGEQVKDSEQNRTVRRWAQEDNFDNEYTYLRGAGGGPEGRSLWG